VYFADIPEQLTLNDILHDPRRRGLYTGLIAHPGIGLIATRTADGVHVETKQGKGLILNGVMSVLDGQNPMALYGPEPYVLRAVESLVNQPNAGDCVLFGEYDGNEIISFDDQVGAHGSAGGDQVYPFLITPTWLGASSETLEDARDMHRVVLLRYSEAGTSASSDTAGSST
jgi:hypothetical protein